MANVPHPVPSRLSHLTAALYGREDDTLVVWQRTCTQVSEALRAQHASERLGKALALAQEGAVELESDGFAVVTSGNRLYHVQQGGTCDCPDSTHRGAPCKHVLAVLIHTRAHELLEPSPSPRAPSQPSPPTPPPARASATWDVHEAPVSSCFKIRVGVCEWTHTIRGADDAEFHRRLRDFVATCREVVQALDALQQERDNAHAHAEAPAPAPQAHAQAQPALTPEALQALQALLAASPVVRNGAATNGQAHDHTPTSPPRCPAHGDMRESTKQPGTWFCAQKLPTGKYCPSKA